MPHGVKLPDTFGGTPWPADKLRAARSVAEARLTPLVNAALHDVVPAGAGGDGAATFALKSDKDSLRVATAMAPDSPLLVVKGSTVVPAPPAVVTSMFAGHDAATNNAVMSVMDPSYLDGVTANVVGTGYRLDATGMNSSPAQLPFFAVRWALFDAPFPLWKRDFVFADFISRVTVRNGVAVVAAERHAAGEGAGAGAGDEVKAGGDGDTEGGAGAGAGAGTDAGAGAGTDAGAGAGTDVAADTGADTGVGAAPGATGGASAKDTPEHGQLPASDNGKELWCAVTTSVVRDDMPELDGVVRGSIDFAGYVCEPVGPEGAATRLHYVVSVNLGGSLPVFIQNIVAPDQAEAVARLRDLLSAVPTVTAALRPAVSEPLPSGALPRLITVPTTPVLRRVALRAGQRLRLTAVSTSSKPAVLTTSVTPPDAGVWVTPTTGAAFKGGELPVQPEVTVVEVEARAACAVEFHLTNPGLWGSREVAAYCCLLPARS